MSAFEQGFYMIDNVAFGPIGLGGNHDKVVRSKNVFTRALFNVVLAPQPGWYCISLIATPKGGFLNEQLNAEDDFEKIFARVPGDVDQQKWKIEMTDKASNTFTISNDNGRCWALSGSAPGTQVVCVTPSAEKETWKFTRVNSWAAKPLDTGTYYIENLENGTINSSSDGERVVSAVTAAQWGIEKVRDSEGLVYKVNILSSGKPANDFQNLLTLPKDLDADEWLIHPLPAPYTYAIFRVAANGPIHWQLESKVPDTQVTVKYEKGTSKLLNAVLEGGLSFVDQFEQLASPTSKIGMDCFWMITEVS